MKQKVVCVWIGKFPSKEEFYHSFLAMKYETEDDIYSEFGKTVGLNWYDEDFIECWWFEKLDFDTLEKYRKGILHHEYFYDDLLQLLYSIEIENFNSITFLFGEKAKYSIN